MNSSMNGIDKRLWCYCGESIIIALNNMPRRTYARLSSEYDGLTPVQVAEQYHGVTDSGLSYSLDDFRRFGSFCYFQCEPRKLLPKGACKRQRGVHLGVCPDTLLPRVGFYRLNAKNNWTWVDRIAHSEVHEKIGVADIDDLKGCEIRVKFSELDARLAEEKEKGSTGA